MILCCHCQRTLLAGVGHCWPRAFSNNDNIILPRRTGLCEVVRNRLPVFLKVCVPICIEKQSMTYHRYIWLAFTVCDQSMCEKRCGTRVAYAPRVRLHQAFERMAPHAHSLSRSRMKLVRFTKSQVIGLVYDVTNRSSFDSIQEWCRQIDEVPALC